MSAALGIIGRPPPIDTGMEKAQIMPDFRMGRPKSTISIGAGNVSRTESADFSAGGFRYNSIIMEQSENENNKHIVSVPGSTTSNPSQQGFEVRDHAPLPSVVCGPSSGSLAQHPMQPGHERKPSSTNSGSSIAMDGGETVIIEERRRKASGDGYTTHKYMRGRLLGKGGFAKVYLCTAMDTGKHYAIKIVPKANLVKERARQKLQTEIKIHRTLKHHNVCEYKHFFEDRDSCYILLELCHNQSLNEMIKRRKRLSEPEAAYFMDQMVEGMKYIHSNQVIHRDLKLGNLFLDKEMNIKIGDLGLAVRLQDPEEKRKTICGTPNYIAPEVIQNDKSKRGHSFEVDIWSMGVVLYTILVGKPPYEAKDVKATYQRILNNEYSFPDNAGLSESAMDLIESMLQTNPHERPSLDYISCHPFLSSRNVPLGLPSSALHFPPSWSRTHDGYLIAETDDTASIKSSKSMKSQTGRSRRPFSRHDPNVQQKPPISTTAAAKKGLDNSNNNNRRHDVRGIVKQALGLAPRPKNPSAGFKIFEETSSARAPCGEDDCDDDMAVCPDCVEIANEQGQEAEEKFTINPFEPPRFHMSDTDVLKQMVKRLDAVLEIAEARKSLYRPQSPRATMGLPAPEKWVTRYVDYTSKYGLGFLLNDGTSGVCFNDSTKTSLERDGERFQYIERKRNANGEIAKSDFTVSTYTLSEYPEDLNKKVTLLKHFRNYLLEQQKKAKEEIDFEAVFSEGTPSQFVYIKKWLRTKHAILFRLSDQTVQIVFYDQTEVLLTPDDQSITYVDKNHTRKSYFLTDELVGTFPELEKRIKYARDILQPLLTAGR